MNKLLIKHLVKLYYIAWSRGLLQIEDYDTFIGKYNDKFFINFYWLLFPIYRFMINFITVGCEYSLKNIYYLRTKKELLIIKAFEHIKDNLGLNKKEMINSMNNMINCLCLLLEKPIFGYKIIKSSTIQEIYNEILS